MAGAAPGAEVLGCVRKLTEEQAMEGNPVSELPSTVVSASVPACLAFLPSVIACIWEL